MATILERIAAYKAQEIAEAKKARSLSQVEADARAATPVRPFRAALAQEIDAGRAALIAEIKKASPSKGLIREDFDPPALAHAYAAGGAACLSVLTDGPSFQGDDRYLAAARAACALPALRKDFLLDPYQVAQSRALGADCILIILAAVDDRAAGELAAAACEWAMDVLVEVHDESELERAIALDCDLMGINNRNLHTFETTLATTERLAPLVPSQALIVGESGISTPQDIARLGRCGVHAFLVGESLMRQADVTHATRSLLSLAGADQPAPSPA